MNELFWDLLPRPSGERAGVRGGPMQIRCSFIGSFLCPLY